MKGRSLLLSAILILIAGVVLIITHKTTNTEGITIVCGILFIVAGLLNIFIYAGEISKKTPKVEKSGSAAAEPATTTGSGPSSLVTFLTWTASIATILLGLCMLVWTETFKVWVIYLFAILITLCAIYQFYLLAIGTRPLRLPGWLFIMPVLLLGAGIYMFCQKPGVDEHLIMLVTGISFVVFSVTMFIESIMIGTANRKTLHRQQAAQGEAKPEEEPVDVEEIKTLDKA